MFIHQIYCPIRIYLVYTRVLIMSIHRYLLPLFFTIIILFSSTTLLVSDISDTIKLIQEQANPLLDESTINDLVNKAAQHQLVLLGESTHGTSEYYYWRKVISRKLIEKHDFNFIVVEGDWPSFYTINKHVKGNRNDRQYEYKDLFVEHFNRWPEWMWANEETVKLVEWLTIFNQEINNSQPVGIYGMDVYSKKESIQELQNYLNSFGEPEFSDKASLLNCFARFDYDGSNYARAIFSGHSGCEKEVLRVFNFLSTNSARLKEHNNQKYFNAKQNALIIKNGEKHYRASGMQDPSSWNYRASHFYQTVNHLLDFYESEGVDTGKTTKGIVWAHNTHIGDARATSMLQQGNHNIGQLARENLGHDNVFLIGFGCHKGEVLAGSSWGSPRQTMTMPEAAENTVDYIFSQVDIPNYYIIIDDNIRHNTLLSQPIGHRAVGVVYNPHREYPGNYVPTILTERYDAFIFFNQTTPLNPLH